jgi:DNA-binding FadR family transcriptional regulator
MKSRAAILKPDSKQAESAEMLGLLQRISGTSPVDVMEARLMVEPHAAAAAAANATAADLAAIREAHDNAAAETDPGSFEKRDAIFHVSIFAATRNELLLSLHDILRVIRNQPAWIEMKRRRYSEARRQGYCSDHEMIVQALVTRDAELASECMKRHLINVQKNLFDQMKPIEFPQNCIASEFSGETHIKFIGRGGADE